jgi:hypothetical protein
MISLLCRAAVILHKVATILMSFFAMTSKEKSSFWGCFVNSHIKPSFIGKKKMMSRASLSEHCVHDLQILLSTGYKKQLNVQNVVLDMI